MTLTKKEKLLALADMIENPTPDLDKYGFNMTMFFGDDIPDKSNRGCGTCACIGGWAYLMAFDGKTYGYGKTSEAAASYLGLTDHEADSLFLPLITEGEIEKLYHHGISADPFNASSQVAVEVIRHFAYTGEIDWARALLMKEGVEVD